MRKLFLKLFIFLFIPLSLQADHKNNHKIPPDSLTPTSADLVGNYTDRFMLSLEPSTYEVAVQYWTGRYIIPHIGIYANQSSKYKLGGILFDYYQWSPQIILIQLPNDQLWDLLPPSAQTALTSLKIDKNYLNNSQKTRGYFSLSGNPYYQLSKHTTLTSPKGYNISFHSSVYPVVSHGENGSPLVGIFDPKGIQSLDIPVNSLKPILVFLHEDASRASSPDNLRFSFKDDKGIFWSLSVYKGEVIVTYHVVLKDDLLEDIIRHVSHQANSLSELIFGLDEAGMEKEVIHFLQQLL